MQWIKLVCRGFLLCVVVVSTDVRGADACPAAFPCTCTADQLDCSAKKLTKMPTFRPSAREFSTLNVSLQDNEIEGLNKNSFSNLKSTGADEFVLNLARNQIHYISYDTFAGIKYYIRGLYLQNNNLLKIPEALQNLWLLETLDLSYNYIESVNGNPLMDCFRLTTLYLSGNPLSYIDPKSFIGLNYLTSLYLDRTKLTFIPEAVTKLPSLSYLDLQGALVNCSCKIFKDETWLQDRAVEINGNCINFEDMPIARYIREEFRWPYC